MCNTRLALPRFLIYCILCMGPTSGPGPLYEPILKEELGFTPIDYEVHGYIQHRPQLLAQLGCCDMRFTLIFGRNVCESHG